MVAAICPSYALAKLREHRKLWTDCAIRLRDGSFLPSFLPNCQRSDHVSPRLQYSGARLDRRFSCTSIHAESRWTTSPYLESWIDWKEGHRIRRADEPAVPRQTNAIEGPVLLERNAATQGVGRLRRRRRVRPRRHLVTSAEHRGTTAFLSTGTRPGWQAPLACR